MRDRSPKSPFYTGSTPVCGGLLRGELRGQQKLVAIRSDDRGVEVRRRIDIVELRGFDEGVPRYTSFAQF